MTNKLAIIIPAFNEEQSIAKVLAEIPSHLGAIIVVVDNGSTDRTAQVANQMGALVVSEPNRGYGAACLAGIRYVVDFCHVDYVGFLDADYSDHAEDLNLLMLKMTEENLDLVLGSRMILKDSRAALLPQARFGNTLACWLMKVRYGFQFTDLGPMRIISQRALLQIRMLDTNFGWTIEMQVKALIHGLKTGEVPVRYRTRIGQSKITGTLKGTISAGIKILWVFFKYAIQRDLRRSILIPG